MSSNIVCRCGFKIFISTWLGMLEPLCRLWIYARQDRRCDPRRRNSPEL